MSVFLATDEVLDARKPIFVIVRELAQEIVAFAVHQSVYILFCHTLLRFTSIA